MVHNSKTFFLGILYIIIPFLGVPTPVKTVLAVLAGLYLISLSMNFSFPQKKPMRKRERITPVFVENVPLNVPPAALSTPASVSPVPEFIPEHVVQDIPQNISPHTSQDSPSHISRIVTPSVTPSRQRVGTRVATRVGTRSSRAKAQPMDAS